MNQTLILLLLIPLTILVNVYLGYHIIKWLEKKGYLIKMEKEFKKFIINMEKKEFKKFMIYELPIFICDLFFGIFLLLSLGIIGIFAIVGVKLVLGEEFLLLVVPLVIFIYLTYSYFIFRRWLEKWWN